MKTVLLLTLVAFSNGGKLDKTYLPPATASSAGGLGLSTPKTAPGLVNGLTGWDYAGNQGPYNAGNVGYTGGINGQYNAGILGQYNTGSFQQPLSNFNNYNSFAANFRPEHPQAVFERNAAILRYDNVNNIDNYAYGYETSNGIAAEETGIATNGVVAQGGYSYLGNDGRQYTIRYTADENGFRPVGDHLPTPPPIPEAILRALEQNARDEAAGIFDDGSYNENLYGERRGYNNGYNYPSANLANLQTIKNIEHANIQAQNLLEQAKQAQAINNTVQANIQAQAIRQLEQAKQEQAINHAAQANIQAQTINHLEQAKQAQAINLLEQAKQAQAINNAVQANIQANQLEQAKQVQAVNHAAQANVEAQAIGQLEQPKQAQANLQAVNNIVQANSSTGLRAYLPPKDH